MISRSFGGIIHFSFFRPHRPSFARSELIFTPEFQFLEEIFLPNRRHLSNID